jgi:RHS repeat-associated protein
VKNITKLNNTVLEYLYDALGHRVQKRSFAGTAQQNRNWTIRDAQGNALATYEQDGINDPIQLKELPIYGSSRTGMHIGGTNPDTLSYGIFTRRLNQRNFEIQDHLGNVRAIVSDLKNPDNTAQVLNLNDYYPFGMISRKEESVVYRYGYNGKEKDDELKGAGNSYDYGARFYDPRVGRWLSIDPLKDIYPAISPFVYSANTPIMAYDPDGRVVLFINGMHSGEGGQSKYWGGFDQLLMKQIGDYSARYIDGALGGLKNVIKEFDRGYDNVSGFSILTHRSRFMAGLDNGIYFVENYSSVNLKVREQAGYIQGLKDANAIIDNLTEGETIKVITHSMGAGFSRGYTKALNEALTSKGLKNRIEMQLDINSFQGGQLAPPSDVQFKYNKTGGEDGKNFLSSIFYSVTKNDFSVPGVAAISGAKDITSKLELTKGHSINTMDASNVPFFGNGGQQTHKPIEQGVNNENASKP